MTPEERRARWEALKLLVGHCNVVETVAFGSSLRYWQSGEVDRTQQWSINETGDLLSPLTFTQNATVLIHGGCQTDLSLADGALVHIKGDLSGKITVAGHSEIVIGGNVLAGAAIEADGISRIFVGGDVDGVILSKGKLTLCTNGNMRGEIATCTPSTRLRVQRDFSGQIHPTQESALLWLEVYGFMPFATLESHWATWLYPL
jgi:cytoskeletal protein CcmA (bactofilin family)